MREMFKVKIDLKLNRSISNENYPKLSKGLGESHMSFQCHTGILLYMPTQEIFNSMGNVTVFAIDIYY